MHSLKNNKYFTNLAFKSLVFFLVAFFILISYEIAFADGEDPIGQSLCSIINTLQGNTVKVIAIAALLSVGVGLFMGKVNWGVALTTAVGVIIMFGAPNIVTFLSSAGGGNNSGTCNPDGSASTPSA